MYAYSSNTELRNKTMVAEGEGRNGLDLRQSGKPWHATQQKHSVLRGSEVGRSRFKPLYPQPEREGG